MGRMDGGVTDQVHLWVLKKKKKHEDSLHLQMGLSPSLLPHQQLQKKLMVQSTHLIVSNCSDINY